MKVKVPEEIINLLSDVRTYLQDKCEPPVYVSDRRLVKAVAIMQVCTHLSPNCFSASFRLPDGLFGRSSLQKSYLASVSIHETSIFAQQKHSDMPGGQQALEKQSRFNCASFGIAGQYFL